MAIDKSYRSDPTINLRELAQKIIEARGDEVQLFIPGDDDRSLILYASWTISGGFIVGCEIEQVTRAYPATLFQPEEYECKYESVDIFRGRKIKGLAKHVNYYGFDLEKWEDLI